MRPEDRDPAYLWDMLDAARTLQRYTAGVTYGQFLGDRGLQMISEGIEAAAALFNPIQSSASSVVREWWFPECGGQTLYHRPPGADG